MPWKMGRRKVSMNWERVDSILLNVANLRQTLSASQPSNCTKKKKNDGSGKTGQRNGALPASLDSTEIKGLGLPDSFSDNRSSILLSLYLSRVLPVPVSRNRSHFSARNSFFFPTMTERIEKRKRTALVSFSLFSLSKLPVPIYGPLSTVQHASARCSFSHSLLSQSRRLCHPRGCKRAPHLP